MKKSKPNRRIMFRSDQPHVEDDAIGLTEPPRGADLVDTTDPAYAYICRAAMELIRFGFDPGDPDIAQRAITVGRELWANNQPSEIAKAFASRPGEVMPPGRTEVVYYMRIGNRVKIGWSTNLTTRLASINPEELMATEPGGRAVERSRHREFSHLHTHGEWFRLDAPLTDHIARLADKAA